MKYRVWITIEEQDDENDRYEDIGLPDPASVELDTLEEAQNVLRRILSQNNPSALRSSDHAIKKKTTVKKKIAKKKTPVKKVAKKKGG